MNDTAVTIAAGAVLVVVAALLLFWVCVAAWALATLTGSWPVGVAGTLTVIALAAWFAVDARSGR